MLEEHEPVLQSTHRFQYVYNALMARKLAREPYHRDMARNRGYLLRRQGACRLLRPKPKCLVQPLPRKNTIRC